MKRSRLGIVLKRDEAARVYDPIIFHVRAPAYACESASAVRLDAAVWGDNSVSSSGSESNKY
jgi:hypothetical protein